MIPFFQHSQQISKMGSNIDIFLSTLLSFDSFLTLILFIFLALLTYHAKGKRRTHTFSIPPGPKPWPLIGSLPELLNNKPAFRWIHKIMDKMNTEIICIRLGNVHVIAVTSPEIALEFLKQQDLIFSSRPISLPPKIASGGYKTTALSPWGEQWKKMRRVLASEVLSMERHRWLQCKRDEESDHLVRYVYNQCHMKGGVVNVRIATQHYCGNMIRKIVFGRRFFGVGAVDGGPGPEEVEHVKISLTIVQYLYSFCISDYIPFLRGYLDLDGHEKIVREACESLRKYQDPIIDERIKQWKEGKKEDQEDILDILIMLKDPNGQPLLSSDEIKAQIVELVLATMDNPSNAVEWALAEMLNQPQTMYKALEELDRVVGNSRLVEESDIPHLNYIKACIKESFRIHPINPFNVPHVSVSDTNVAGYFIPRGSHVLLSRPGLGRNPRVWPEPLHFIPERHLKDDGSNVGLTDPDLRILSFSIGRRGCAGVTLGSTITVMLFARLLHGFSWSLPSDVAKIELKESPDDMLLAKPLVAIAKPRLDKKLYQQLGLF